MPECRQGHYVPSDRRTCAQCGEVLNLDGKDPTVQKEERPGAALARLRLENIELQKSVEAHEQAAKRSGDQIASLQQSLDDLGAELELLMLEQQQMRAGFQALVERTRLLQARFDALGASTYRPFSASQATLFGPGVENSDPASL